MAPWQVAVVASVAAIAGDQVGYWIGKRYGRRLFKDDARILTTARLDEAEAFFTRWGGLSLVLGRFVPSSAPTCPSLRAPRRCTTAGSCCSTSSARSPGRAG